ncbi:MAG: hypothetical protein M3Z96_11095 [Pseudomonadota bacterium]|nr:hypothetical protein [Pseudomonadota bacterium]
MIGQNLQRLGISQYSTERGLSQSTILFTLTFSLTARRLAGFRVRGIGEKGSPDAQPGHHPSLLILWQCSGGRSLQILAIREFGMRRFNRKGERNLALSLSRRHICLAATDHVFSFSTKRS